MAKCPKCRTVSLRSALGAGDSQVDESSPLRCPTCEGMWFTQDEAERLVRRDALVEEAAPEDTGADDAGDMDAKVGMCPFGHSILTRARVDVEDPFHLDRCHACGGIWFDQGEWARLASSQMLHLLRDLWNPVWRKQLRQARELAAWAATLEARIGKDAMTHVQALIEALREHPHRNEALAYLSDRLRVVGAMAGGRKDPGPPDADPAA